MERIKDFFKNENIEFYAVLPADSAEIINTSRQSETEGFKSIIVFLMPYKTHLSPSRNLARFASARDYHLYASRLFERFEVFFPNCRCYCDNSPVNEKLLAARAGLGVIGDNTLLINEKYGSFVFIGEIFLKEKFENYTPLHTVRKCISCGACKKACPVELDFSRCISAINQKKKISPDEQEIIRTSQYKWGCDHCQDVCPYNLNAPETPIDFFKNEILDNLTAEKLDIILQNGSFSQRAYAWRGEKTVRRNIEL
ncbi:MAG: epoxyqueuosine reductase [Ruminococcaceae bacterium]|nr:epoxyqueuosine reductase [Oscillospiraceae bacterium]